MKIMRGEIKQRPVVFLRDAMAGYNGKIVFSKSLAISFFQLGMGFVIRDRKGGLFSFIVKVENAS